MLRIVILLGISVLLALASGPVLKTGQVKSYDEFGNVVTDGSIKDDGYYQAGKARGYSCNHIDRIVIDNATGLQWNDSVSIKKKWEDASDDTAAAYCTALPTSKYPWRLPTIQELQTLVDNSQFNPALSAGIFSNIEVFVSYWSSTAHANIIDQAWGILFYDGTTDYYDKSSELFVRCVQGKSLIPSSFSRSGSIVTDSTTGLQWQDNYVAGNWTEEWVSAIDYCENILTLGGYTDWRLPNINELSSIVDFTRQLPAINPIFENVKYSIGYNSSTTVANFPDKAWRINFRYGTRKRGDKIVSPKSALRCVRGGQVNISINPSIIMYLLD